MRFDVFQKASPDAGECSPYSKPRAVQRTQTVKDADMNNSIPTTDSTIDGLDTQVAVVEEHSEREAPTFEQLGVHPDIVKSLNSSGFTHSFAIQELTLPIALSGSDLIGQAKTGMGKTLGFGIPLLHRLASSPAAEASAAPPRALIIVPTRELCVQVSEDLKSASSQLVVDIGENSSRPFSVAAIYGGAPFDKQIAELEKGCDVVVGTPGRLIDLARQNKLVLGAIQVLVMDEADEMLDLGFLPDIEKLVGMVPDKRQTMLFSATMPGPIITLARTFLSQPTHIRAETNDSGATHANTQQFAYRSHNMDRIELTSKILQARGTEACIIFTRTKRTAQHVADDLEQRGFSAGALHGNLGQSAREKALKKFRNGEITILVATDVAARGIDVDNVSHVINYQCPDDHKTYVHRIGRTGRAGRSGVAITLVDWEDLEKWKLINSELKLGIEDPVETYSTSAHIFSDLNIPQNVTGSIGPAIGGKTSSQNSGRGRQRGSSGQRKSSSRNSQRRGGKPARSQQQSPESQGNAAGEKRRRVRRRKPRNSQENQSNSSAES